jgi:hypothetical protein
MKTRLPIMLAIGLLAGMLLTACGLRVINGSGNIMTEARPVSDFRALNFTGFGELTLVQGETEALTIETDDNLLPYLRTSVSQGVLTIGFTDGVWLPIIRPTRSIRYTLTVKALTALELSGAGTVESVQLTADQLALAVSGAGQITIDDLTASDLTVDMSGSGRVALVGQVTNQTVDMSGLDSYEAGNLASQTAKITLSGAGAATVWVREQLDAEMSGAGTISYYGSPRTSASSSGIGRVQSLGDK